MGGRVDHATFASHADCSERVVSRNHTASKVSSAESLDGGCRSGLQLVFEDDEAQEPQAGLGLFAGKEMRTAYRPKVSDLPLHLLSFKPRQSFDTLAGHGDDAISTLGIVRQEVVVVVRDCDRE